MAPLFAVSTRTFVLLSVCTLGLYELYWCYQNWKRVKFSRAEDLSPFWRAVFAPLWGFSLFRRIRSRAAAAGIPTPWNSNLLATVYLLFAMARMLPEPWSFISLFGFVAIIPVQRAAQRVNAQQAEPGTHWHQDTDGPADLNPVFAPPPRGSTLLKPRYAALIAAVLGCWILMGYIGEDIAHHLTPSTQSCLWIAVTATLLGLLAAVCGRSRIALACYAVTISVLVGLQIVWDRDLAQARKQEAQSIRVENQNRLSKALAKAPCDNGDIAVISTSRDPLSPRITMNLDIIHPSHTQLPETWERISGEGDPPDKSGINKYREAARTECRQAGQPSLDDLYERLRQHYWSEHHKYVR